PLTPKNHHLLNTQTFNQIKNRIIIINTSHDELINSQTTIKTLKQQKINSLNMDMYKNKHNLFFKNKSNDMIQNNIFHHLSA
ncbi:2-hydroxyacid dehydrogenase, partial [Bacillus sp. MBGLi97]